MSEKEGGKLLSDGQCKMCGREFVFRPSVGWCYRRGKHMFCSWGCMREYDHERAKNHNKRNNGPIVCKMIGEGMSNYQIAKELNISYKAVSYWKAKIRRGEI